MSRGRHPVVAGFALGPRKWLIASATIASVFLAAAVGIARQTGSAAGATAHASYNFWEGKRCIGLIEDLSRSNLTLVRDSKWDTDTWKRGPIRHIGYGGYSEKVWETKGGDFRGCHNEVTYQYTYDISGHAVQGTLDFSITKPWTGKRSFRCQSPSENYGLRCELTDVFDNDEYASVQWKVVKSRR
jgi:hypothetical protein